jgi:hypothetical protein
MTYMQNQALEAPLNTLHDEGIPNTLGGICAPSIAVGLRLPAGGYVAAGVALLALLAIVAVLAIQAARLA